MELYSLQPYSISEKIQRKETFRASPALCDPTNVSETCRAPFRGRQAVRRISSSARHRPLT